MTKALTIGIYLVAAIAAADVAAAAVALKETRDYRAFLAADQKRRDEATRLEREAAAPKPLDIKGNCSGNGFSYNCTFTNLNDVSTTSRCSHGKLSQKANPGVTLVSVPLCSGVLAPRETRQVSAPWYGGEPEAVCNKPNGFGGTALDWKSCEFDVVRE